MKNFTTVRWLGTSVLAFVLVFLVALGVESSSERVSSEKSAETMSGAFSSIDVFEGISFVDGVSSDDPLNEETSSVLSEEQSNEENSFEANSSEPNSSEVNSSESNNSEASSSESNNSEMNSSEFNNSEMNSSEFENSEDNSSEENSFEINSSEVNSSEENSSEENSSEVNSSEGNSSEEPSKDNVSSDFPDDVTLLENGETPFVYFKQDDPKYNNLPYGTDTVGSHGCGPVNMAMIISTYTGKVIYPAEAAKWSVDNGYWAKGVGSSHGLMTAMANAYGVPVTTIPKSSWTTAMNALKQGKYLITRVGNGAFSSGPHFITIRGITDDGKLLLANSISYDDSVTQWSQSTVRNNITLDKFWVYG